MLILCKYMELSQKKQVSSVAIAALCLYSIQRENLVFKKALCMYDKTKCQIKSFLTLKAVAKKTDKKSKYFLANSKINLYYVRKDTHSFLVFEPLRGLNPFSH